MNSKELPVSGARRALRREADVARRHKLVRGAPLLPEVERFLKGYVPRAVAPDDWTRIKPVVLEWLYLASPTDVAIAGSLLTKFSRLVLWAESLHLPIDPKLLFEPAMLDRFVVYIAENFSDATAKDTRSKLHRYGPLLGDPKNWPQNSVQFVRNKVYAPLSADEELLALKLAQSWSVHHEAMIVLGFGFGLDGRWLPHQSASDLVIIEDWPHLNVCEPDARVVPVLARYRDLILDIVERVPEGPLIGGTGNVQNQCWSLARRIVFSADRRLRIGEMRNTWFTAHLLNNTDLVYLSQISGRKSFQRLLELLEHVEPKAPIEAARQARLA